jgi:hypothetical protein
MGKTDPQVRREMSATCCSFVVSDAYPGFEVLSQRSMRTNRRPGRDRFVFHRPSWYGPQQLFYVGAEMTTTLPGLIQNETAEAINLVRNLVVDSIADERTLILVAIPVRVLLDLPRDITHYLIHR